MLIDSSTIDSNTITMRISELSRHSGVSVASIKYYTREGLLSGGERVGYNQTHYVEAHVGRLKLIRALMTAGNLSIASVKDVLAAIDDDELELGEVLSVAQHASSLVPIVSPTPEAVERTLTFIGEQGWNVCDSNPGVAMVASALDGLTAANRDDLAETLTPYAHAADHIGQSDIADLASDQTQERSAETVVVGTVLGDTIVAGLRRIAQEHHARRQAPPAQENSWP